MLPDSDKKKEVKKNQHKAEAEGGSSSDRKGRTQEQKTEVTRKRAKERNSSIDTHAKENRR